MACASKGIPCFRPLSRRLGLAVFRQRPVEGMELCSDVGAAGRERRRCNSPDRSSRIAWSISLSNSLASIAVMAVC
jgi:hypothetical protein